MIYEQHFYSDAKFPVIFHNNVLRLSSTFVPHWHQNLEILYFLEGTATVTINTYEVKATPGTLIVVPSNALHHVRCADVCTHINYYCLIPDNDFCDGWGVPLSNLSFDVAIHDKEANQIFDEIIKEYHTMQDYFKPRILALVFSLLVLLSRTHLSAPSLILSKSQVSQLEMIKKVLSYVDKNYADDLSIDTLAEYVGFNRYYFCHIFKDLTHMTAVSYINYVRCKKAKEILARTGCSVSEAAAKCGFSNLSYFTRTYRKYVGTLPSRDMISK